MEDLFFIDDANYKNDVRAYLIPQCVSVTKNASDDTDDQIVKVHEKFLKLSEGIKTKLASEETGNKVQQIGKSYHLQLLQMADIARAIRSYYFGEIKLEDISHVLFKEMGIDLDTSKEISKIVIEKIIMDESAEKIYQSSIENISIIDAMKKYPGLGEQIITSQQIRIKNFNDPIRPSIKNWLSDYTARLGYEGHDSIERGNYLFQNENTRNLGYEDRQRLSQILKSFDEKTPLAVDLNTKQVVFSAYAPEKKQEAQAISDKFPIPNPQIGSGEIKGFPMENKPAYQPKTKEPGDDFEKVIGFGEKREEEAPPTFNAPRIVNLKEEKREKPAIAPSVPQPKNLLNIKELVEQSRKEREANNPASAPYDKPAMENRPSETKKSFQAFPFDSQKELAEKQQIKTDINSIRKEKLSLSPENNFIPHSYSQNIKGSNTGSFRESLDETEKKLFQTNNHLAQKKLAGGYYSPTEGASGSGMQFSSPHKLPFEQEKEKLEQKSIEPIQPEVPPKPKAQPYRIFPSTME